MLRDREAEQVSEELSQANPKSCSQERREGRAGRAFGGLQQLEASIVDLERGGGSQPVSRRSR